MTRFTFTIIDLLVSAILTGGTLFLAALGASAMWPNG